jgi:hypothetical protein
VRSSLCYAHVLFKQVARAATSTSFSPSDSHRCCRWLLEVQCNDAGAQIGGLARQGGFDRRTLWLHPAANMRSIGMCDYSLQHVATRAAKVGDKLASTQFVNSNTRGFSAIEEQNVAVCLLPGTELVFDRGAVLQVPAGALPVVGSHEAEVALELRRHTFVE